MINEDKELKRAGTFTLSPGKDIYGELTLAGQQTSLYLQDKDYFDPHAIPGQCVKGVLRDLTKVTLIQCATEGPGNHSSQGEIKYHFANIFPHFVVHGNRHINPAEKTIADVHFVVDDASTLFYDFDAFGSLIDARPFIEQIAHANGLEREIRTGPEPQILYFTGKREIFSADTVLGNVSASHNPNRAIGGPNGVSLKNTIIVTITFSEEVTFNDAINHTLTLLKYLEVVVGRPQNLLRLDIRIKSDGQLPGFLNVYWSLPPRRNTSDNSQRPHPADVLVDAVRQPDAFSRVLGSWLDRQKTWYEARLRFSDSFAQQQEYTIDRLIRSANMFDILPDSAVPPGVQLSEELMSATKCCSEIFKKLQQSPERDSVLSALGRVGKSNLKRKIRHRAQLLIDALGKLFPDLLVVTDEAVDCRNHYVHGSKPIFDYSKEFDSVVFFTDTLEFVFAASDFIEAGWDIKAWSEIPTTMSHPFGRYRINYAANLKNLKVLIL